MTAEAMRALDEIEAQLTGADGWLTKIEGDDREQMMALGHHNVKQALRLLPTLRAALAPGADGEVEAIKRRHEAETQERPLCRCVVAEGWASQAHTDRATLLAHVDRLSAELANAKANYKSISAANNNVIDGLKAELAKERERRVEVEGALKFYANELNHIGHRDPSASVYIETSAVEADGGKRARAALSQEGGS